MRTPNRKSLRGGRLESGPQVARAAVVSHPTKYATTYPYAIHFLYIPSGKLTWLWKITIFIGKPSINGPFSMAMLNNQRVYVHVKIVFTHTDAIFMVFHVFSISGHRINLSSCFFPHFLVSSGGSNLADIRDIQEGHFPRTFSTGQTF